MSSRYADKLDQLFQISPVQARQQRQSRFNQRTGDLKGPVILWGCGALGSHVAKTLTGSSLTVQGFVDKRPELWGKIYQGCPVISPESLRGTCYQDCLVIITVYTSEPLRQLLGEWGIPFLTFPELAWGMPERFIPYYALDCPDIFFTQKEAVRTGLLGWANDLSQEEYLGQLEWRLTLNYEVLPPHLSAKETYFPCGLIALQSNEHYVDCGAFDGDSIRELLDKTVGQFDRITAFEPDPINFQRLTSYADSLSSHTLSRMQLIHAGVGHESTIGHLTSAAGTVRSTVEATAGDPVDITTLDSVLTGAAPTFIKMDIEGFEPFALKGGAAIIQKHRPILAVCLYHAFDHLWTIPNYLHSLVPDYKLYLCRHSDECWESICYAIPPSRVNTS